MGKRFEIAFQEAQDIGRMAFEGTKEGVHNAFIGIQEAFLTGQLYAETTGHKLASKAIDVARKQYHATTTVDLDSLDNIGRYYSYLRNQGIDPKTSTAGIGSRVQLPSITDTARFRYGSTNGKGGYNYALMAKDSAKVAGAMTAAGIGVVGINSMINGD